MRNLFEYNSYGTEVMQLCNSLNSSVKILGYGLELGKVTKSYYNANKQNFPKMVDIVNCYNINAAKYCTTRSYVACFTKFELVYKGEIYQYIDISSEDELFNLSTVMDLELIKCMFIWKCFRHLIQDTMMIRFNFVELDGYINRSQYFRRLEKNE